MSREMFKGIHSSLLPVPLPGGSYLKLSHGAILFNVSHLPSILWSFNFYFLQIRLENLRKNTAHFFGFTNTYSMSFLASSALVLWIYSFNKQHSVALYSYILYDLLRYYFHVPTPYPKVLVIQILKWKFNRLLKVCYN